MKKIVTRYESLADEISAQIRTGVLREGDRVPSVRSFSRARGLSSNTVLQAYHLLEDRGEIRARMRSGYYVVRPPAEGAVETLGPLRSKAKSGEDLAYELFELTRLRNYVHLGIAWPSTQLYPLDKLARAFTSSSRRLGAESVAPYFPRDNADLRRRIARRGLEWGFNGDADEVVLTAGTLEALNLCLHTVTRPGGLVAIESATLYAVRNAIERSGLRAVEIPTHPKDGVSLSALSTALRKQRIQACLFMPTFQHPLGSTMPEDKKRELVRLLASHDIPLIENDVCGELYYGESRPRPAKAFDRKGLVLYCSSFSKSLAPGYVVGWAMPGRFTRAVQRAKWTANTMSGIPNQAAILDFIEHGSYEHHLRRLRRTLAALQKQAVQAVLDAFPAGTTLSRPAGGYITWVQLPKKISATALYRLALAHRITLAPGPVFSAQPQYANCFRLNYGHEWTDRIDDAVVTLGRLAKTLL
jgi:DNA-binding transcriptional MocR family regulator